MTSRLILLLRLDEDIECHEVARQGGVPYRVLGIAPLAKENDVVTGQNLQQ
jgi:hypothetical protein